MSGFKKCTGIKVDRRQKRTEESIKDEEIIPFSGWGIQNVAE